MTCVSYLPIFIDYIGDIYARIPLILILYTEQEIQKLSNLR
jgi:hypothetical protein